MMDTLSPVEPLSDADLREIMSACMNSEPLPVYTTPFGAVVRVDDRWVQVSGWRRDHRGEPMEER